MQNTVIKTQLANGLTVLLKASQMAPVTTFWSWYRVGSRNEVSGRTGIAHWIEHMLTARFTFEDRNLNEVFSRLGGINNASTSLDYTNYFATLPPQHVDTALRTASQRMSHYQFIPELEEIERTVVMSERQMRENSPVQLLMENLMLAAFQVHPYRHDPVGHLCDLQSMTHADLQQFYDTYYVPKNAILVAVGPFDPDTLLEQIKSHFADISPGEKVPPVTACEPVQRGERRIQVAGPGQTTYIEMAFHTPPPTHEDFLPLIVLDAALTGAGALALLGGGSSNVSSRLYGALVDSELAVDAWGGLYPTVDPFFYSIAATVRSGRTPDEVEAAIDRELERIIAEPITAQELTRAIKQAKAQFAYSSESVTGQALWLGFSEIFADYKWFENYIENLSAVTIEGVQRVAQTYLPRFNRTIAWYVPDQSKENA